MKIKNSKKIILNCCEKMIAGEMGFLTGCIEIHKNVFNIYGKNQFPDDIFSIFILISSESTHIPLGEEAQELYSKAYLKKLDKEAEKLINFYKKDIIKGCYNVINHFELTCDDIKTNTTF